MILMCCAATDWRQMGGQAKAGQLHMQVAGRARVQTEATSCCQQSRSQDNACAGFVTCRAHRKGDLLHLSCSKAEKA